MSLAHQRVDKVTPATPLPAIPVGRIKSFGPLGSKYQVGHATRQLPCGDWMVEVTMIETGEKTEYRLTRLNDDPEAV